MDEIHEASESAIEETAEHDESVESDESQSNEKIIEEAKARFKLAEEATSDIRLLAKEDWEFRAGEQWPQKIKQDRNIDARPCLVVNHIPGFVQQITNDQRQNRPSINVHPVDSVADPETADIIKGLIRHIENNSNADLAYDTAFEGAVTGGFGYWRVLTDFVAPDSFDQEILIKRIKNHFSVLLDPYHQEPDGSDANWGFIVDDIASEEFKAKYPESALSRAGADWEALGNDAAEWIKRDAVRVAEYFYKEYHDETIHLLSTGETVRDAELLTRLQAAAAANLPVQVVRSRITRIPVIKWCKLNGIEILKKTDWPGIYIPIIPVYGAELDIDGKRILEGIVRHAKDPQRMRNYLKSAEAEAIALAPKAPFIGAEGQFEGHEAEWETANVKNHAFLEYKPTTINGQLAPPPQRQAFEPAIQAITQASMGAAEDLKSTTGIYAPNPQQDMMGASGIAIKRRNSQVQTSNFHFVDNLARSIHHTGRICVDLIPHIYDTARAERIIGDDGEHKVTKLNQKHLDENGKEVLYDLSAGRYDVTINVGPSFASKREEASEAMMQVTQANPQLMSVVGDLMIKNMDWPGAQEIAERLKKMLPPQLQDQGNMKDVPPQIQAQMAHMGEMIKGLTENLNEATKVIETKKLELEHRERVELMKLQTDAEIQLAKLGTQSDIALLKHEIEMISERMQYLRMSEPIDAPNNFDPQQADGGNYAGVGHIGGTANLTGEASPGLPVGEPQ